MDKNMLGGVLLIAGTCIGGGMLGLPIVTAKSGFLNSTVLFIFCWALMTFTALLTLEVNLCFQKGSNIFSMVKATLNNLNAKVLLIIYLLFLYSLVCAYIAGGRDLIYGIFKAMGREVSIDICSILFITLFSFIVLTGIRSVEIFNSLIMALKLILLFLLVLFIGPHVNFDYYFQPDLQLSLPIVSVAITSFGFSIIVPSIRGYFDHDSDSKKSRKIIIIGSIIPLLCYVAWNTVILGIIPLNGKHGLDQLRYSSEPIFGLLEEIHYYAQSTQATILSKMFISISILTSFVCVSLALSDYLSDIFKIKTRFRNKWAIAFSTFVPPLIIVSLYPKAFILFLSLAGLFCVILQCLIPTLMAWNCRYIKKISSNYQVWGGKASLFILILLSLNVIFIILYEIVYTPIN